MKVQGIQNHNNYNPNFNGFVDKSVKKYVENVVKTECNKLVADANKDKVEVEKDALKNIYDMGKRVLNKLNSFMKPQHEKSFIALDSGSFSIKNPISKSKIKFFTYPQDKGLYESSTGSISIGVSKYYNLEKLENLETIADDLLATVEPKDVDKSFLSLAEQELKDKAIYDNGIGFIGRFKTMHHAKSVDKFGKEIGAETTTKEDAKSYIQYVVDKKQKRKDMTKYTKELETKNAQILKDVLTEKK